MPDAALTAINNVMSLPDVGADNPNLPAILRLYNAGILTGVDQHGTFIADRTITREEIATIVTRVADLSLRKQYTLG